MLYDSIYIISWKRQNYRDGIQFNGSVNLKLFLSKKAMGGNPLEQGRLSFGER